jgi:hypothetical protein
MRIASKNRPHHEQDADAYDQKYIDSLPETNLPPTVVIPGTPPKLEKEYPAEAVKKYQDKPIPQHSKHAGGAPKQHIQQPRKN